MATEKLYKNNKPWNTDYFTECLNEQIEKRIKINMASVILIDGGQGQGKTTLAVHIADYINKYNGFPLIDLSIKNHKQIGLGGADFISKFNKCYKNKLPVIIYDEAGDYSKASTLSWFNYQISKLFQKIRSARIIVLLCLPNFNILDNRLFDDEIIRGAIHLHSRQITVNYGNFSVYDMEGLSWVRYWYSELPSARKRRAYSMSNPIFMSHFKNLPTGRRKQLEILSNYGKAKERHEAEVNMRGLKTIKDIMREVNRSEIWVRKKLKEHNIKAAEKLGTSNYYNKWVINKLEKDLSEKRK